jgi:hypothetical protein
LNVNAENIFGTVAMLIVFVAVQPMLNKAISLLTSSLGPAESFMARSITLIIFLGIGYNLFDSGDPGGGFR